MVVIFYMDDASTLSDRLLHDAFHLNATDIHFHPHKDQVTIYFRILGERKHHKSILKETYQLLLTYFKFTSGMDIGEQRKPQNGTISIDHDSIQYSLRLSTLPVNKTESLAIRILPQKNDFSLNELFLFPNQLKKMKKWFSNKAGIILFSGPTGSGKTTTMYTLLQSFMEKQPFQTITLEDPVEKQLDDILQVQINEKAGITFHSGLRAALRHDPDIILVGEILDKETAKFAFKASLTGHLVLSTIHAHNALGTIQRLLDMELTKLDLAQSLLAVAALQLVPIEINNQVFRRAAIAELLDGEELMNQILRDDLEYKQPFQTFDHLRKKAFAYGYISKQSLFIS